MDSSPHNRHKGFLGQSACKSFSKFLWFHTHKKVAHKCLAKECIGQKYLSKVTILRCEILFMSISLHCIDLGFLTEVRLDVPE